MPLELQVVRASEFVRLGAEGHLDFGASKEALQTLARACWKRGLKRALLDLRALPIPPKPVFTPSQLAALVEVFGGAGFTRKHRLAVLYRIDLHGGARMFAFISRRRGWQVQAFGDFEKGYLIVDRAGVRVLRDPYSAKPHVLFYTTKRVGGGVQNFDAIKVMKFAAS